MSVSPISPLRHTSCEVILCSHISDIFMQTSVHSPFCLSMMIQHDVKTNIIHSKREEEKAGLKRTLKAGSLLDSDTDSLCNLCGAIWELYCMAPNTASGFVCDL